MLRRLIVLAVAFVWALLPTAARTQQGPGNCGEYQGIVCDGWFTDDAGVTEDPDALEEAIGRLVAAHGHQIALVVTTDSRGDDPFEFAADLGDAWGVGDPQRDDGVVVLVDLAARRTVVRTGPGLDLPDPDAVAGAGNSFFGVGQWDAGLAAVVGSLEQALARADTPPPDNGAPPTTDGGEPPVAPPVSSDGDGSAGVLVIGAVAAAGLLVGGAGLVVANRRRDEETMRRREELVDGELGRLEPAGHELPLVSEFATPFEGDGTEVPTVSALAALKAIATGMVHEDRSTVEALWRLGLVAIVDRVRLETATRVPLELRSSGERAILEDAVQQAARDCLEVDPDEDELFEVRRNELNRLVDSLRPHRVAAARRRIGDEIVARLARTGAGWVLITDEGTRFLRAGAALDSRAPLGESKQELDEVYRAAQVKATRLEALYEKLPANTTRPAVAAALADLDDDAATSFARYERVRVELEEIGMSLEADGLALPAVAALLLMNNDEDDVDDFVAGYETNRHRGLEPSEAVEYALAGLQHPGDLESVREAAGRLGLPISITAALLRRRDDGPEVFAELLDELAGADVKGDTRRTIAAILAVSLEPAQAMRRWIGARDALEALGLTGSYADVAAAFGASDPRGPRVFALAYAAQRQALARSKITDADRFAPELAHAGTSRQTDTWTGEPIPRGLGYFDPYTLLFYHWVITRGHSGAYGWEPIYRDNSWSGDRGSWWGQSFPGWGGGTVGGGGGGSSSWGGGGWGGFGGGGFGGFGGGGFGGGGGGSSGW